MQFVSRVFDLVMAQRISETSWGGLREEGFLYGITWNKNLGSYWLESLVKVFITARNITNTPDYFFLISSTIQVLGNSPLAQPCQEPQW